MKNFLVSYNKADRDWAEWIAWQLEDVGYTLVIQAWDFRPSSNFVLEMQRASSEAKRTIAVLSPDYLNALYTHPEWATAFAQDPTGDKGFFLPIRVRECALEGLLKQILYIDLVGLDDVTAKTTLLDGVDFARAKPARAPAFPAKVIAEPKKFPGNRVLDTFPENQHRSFVAPPGASELAIKVQQPGEELRQLLRDREKYREAIRAIFQAVFEEKRYLKTLRHGLPNLRTEEQLTRSWFEAFHQLFGFHSDLANICLVKAFCWTDEQNRNDAKYSNLLDVDMIFEQMRSVLGENYGNE